MLEINNQYTLMRRKIETEVMRHFFNGTLVEEADKLPIRIIPKDRIANRCCIYKESSRKIQNSRYCWCKY